MAEYGKVWFITHTAVSIIDGTICDFKYRMDTFYYLTVITCELINNK